MRTHFVGGLRRGLCDGLDNFFQFFFLTEGVISVAGFCAAGAGAGASDFEGFSSRLGGAVGSVVGLCEELGPCSALWLRLRCHSCCEKW